MEENIWILFECPNCTQEYKLGFNEWVKCMEMQHFYCWKCNHNFHFVIDYDYNIKYVTNLEHGE